MAMPAPPAPVLSDDDLAARYAAQPASDPVTDMLPLVRHLESSGDNAVSPAGAIGRYQIMPATARGYGFDPAYLSDPTYNEEVARTVLGDLHSKYGDDAASILAAYNAGPAHADRFRKSGYNMATLPLETQRYLARAVAYVQPATAQAPATPAAPASGTLSDADLSSKYGLSDAAIEQRYGLTQHGAPPAAAPAADPGIIGALEEGLQSAVRGFGRTAEAVGDIVPGARDAYHVVESLLPAAPVIGLPALVASHLTGAVAQQAAPSSAATQPIDFSGHFDPKSIFEKTLFGVANSVPAMGAAIVGGAKAAAGTTAAQEFGNYYDAEIKKTPDDKAGAAVRAGQNAAVDAASTFLGWKLFEFAPFKSAVGTVTNNVTGAAARIYQQSIKDMIKNIALQGVAIQPAVSMAATVAHNLLNGDPPLTGLPQAYANGAIGNTIMMTVGHLIAPPGTSIGTWRTPAPPEGPGPHPFEQPPLAGLPTPSGPRSPGGAPRAAAPPEPPLAPNVVVGLHNPDGSVERAVVDRFSPDGKTVLMQYEDGTSREHLTSEVLRDRAPAPPPRQQEPQPIYRGPQLTPDEAAAPPLGEEYQPPAPSQRAARRAPQPELDPAATHGLDMALRLENAALDQNTPMSAADRTAALMQAARLRQRFGLQPTEQGAEPYQHPLAGEPAAPLAPLATARQANPAAYEPEAAPRQHPLATEPAAPLGELARARVEQPSLYQGEYTRPATPTAQENEGAAARTDTAPTPAQADAGNARKGHTTVQGIPISIETPRGVARTGTGANGEPWSATNPIAHYGYITRTGQTGADNEHIDAYIGPHPGSDTAYVVDQADPQTGAFDESKGVLGAGSGKQAAAIYDAGFSDGSGPARRAAITPVSVPNLKIWLKEGDTHSPFNPEADPEHVAAARDVDELRARIPADQRTPSLFDAIRTMGGIKVRSNSGADLAYGPEIRKNQEGLGAGTLIRKNGLPPDEVRQRLAEQGWFGGNPADDMRHTDLNDLLDLMDREAAGQKVFHPESPMVAALERRDMMREEADRAGINKDDSRADAAKKLAAFRRQGAQAMADEYQSQVDRDIEGLSPGARELLTEYGYEPGADVGEDHETGQGDHEPEGARSPVEATQPQRVGQEDRGEGAQEAENHREPAAASAVEFKTAKGSRYIVHDDGTTTRDKAARPEHPGEQGTQPRSERTVYVTTPEAEELSLFQTQGGPKMAIAEHSSGAIGVKYLDGKDAGKFERRTMVTPQTKPAVGLTPVETWRNGERVHFGNVITEIGAPAASEPVDLGRGAKAEQTVLPGAERSARQLAAGREVAGHGRKATKVEQREPDGLFAPPPDTRQKTLFQVGREPSTEKPFYSALTRGIESIKQEKAGPLQWMATIAKLRNEGVRQSDIEASGIVPWLRLHNGPVAKTDVLAHLKAQEAALPSRVGGNLPRSETVALADDLFAKLPTNPSPVERALIDEVAAIANRIAPTARVRAARQLTLRDRGKALQGDHKIWGATYSNGARRLIAWSMESPHAPSTLRHEAVHYLRNTNFLTPDEWETLSDAAETGDWIKAHDLDERYPDSDHADKIEEAVAEEYARWAASGGAAKAPFERVFNKIKNLLGQVGAYLRKKFGAEATAEDVFRSMESGEVGSRKLPSEMERQEPTMRQEPRDSEGPVRAIEDGRDPIEAGRAYIDQTAQDIAAATDKAPPNTYARTLQKLGAPDRGDRFLDANALQRHVMGPRTVAEMDTPSAKLWNRIKERGAAREAMVHDLRDKLADSFLKLPEASQARVNAVMELDRLNSRTRINDGRSIVARNEKNDLAQGSKPGDALILTPNESKGYFELQNMYRRAWDHVMHGTAVRLGWDKAWGDDMSANIKAVEDAAENADHPRERKEYKRLADVLHVMDAQRRAAYMPLMRFGDYYISVKPKEGSDPDSEGGFPRTKWFELVERPPLAEYSPKGMIAGRITKTGDVPAHAQPRIDDLKKQFPDHVVEHGWLTDKPGMLRDLDIPAVEKLFTLMEGGVLNRLRSEESMGDSRNKKDTRAAADKRYNDLYGELVDAIQNEMYENLKAGFKRKANTVAGYSPDFARALGSYVNWTSNHVADNLHRDDIERQFDEIQMRHPHKSIKEFWQKWRADDESPSSPLSKAAAAANQIGFLYTLAWNPASTLSIMMHGPNFAIPVLSTGIRIKDAGRHFAMAYGDAIRGIKADTQHGMHVDPALAGKTIGERAFLKTLATEGELHAKGADDVRSMGEKGASLWGEHAPLVRRAMDIASSNIGAADQANRITVALAAYRLAKAGNLADMAKAWATNQVWRDMAQRHGTSPETMGRFLLGQAVGEWGPEARSEFGRAPLGRLMTSLHGFQVRFLSNLAKQAFRQGPAGRLALAWTLTALWAAAGLQGLPFMTDAENATDYLWKLISGGHDPMSAFRVRQWIADTGLGKIGADIVLRGPLSHGLGVDMSSRLGFGDVISRDLGPILGITAESALTMPSIVKGIFDGVDKTSKSHQGPLATIAAGSPAAIRHPLQAIVAGRTGIKSQTGHTMYVPPSQVTPAEEAEIALGFTPIEIAYGREHANYRFRAAHAHGTVPKDMTPR